MTLQDQYECYCAECEETNQVPLSFDEWRTDDDLSPCQAITKLIDDLDEKPGDPATTEELWDAMRSIAAIAAP